MSNIIPFLNGHTFEPELTKIMGDDAAADVIEVHEVDELREARRATE